MAPSSWICASFCLASGALADSLETKTLLQMTKVKSNLAEVKQAANAATEHSGELAFVETLASNLATTKTKIDDVASQALTAIQTTLTNSLQLIQSAHDGDVTALTNDEGVYVACGTAFATSKAADASAKTELDNKETTHSTCRTKLGGEDDDKNTKCNDLTTFIQGLNPPACGVPQDGKLYNHFAQIETYVTSNKDLYKTKDEACTAATTLGQNTETTCDQDQDNMESAACSLEVSVYATCNTYNSCADAAKADFDTTCTSAVLKARQRSVEFVSIKKIQCYITKILNSADLTLDDLMECKNLDPTTGHLGITCPTLTDKEDCDFSSVQNVPCNAGWMAKYENMLGVDACTECAALAPEYQALKDGVTSDSGNGLLAEGTCYHTPHRRALSHHIHHVSSVEECVNANVGRGNKYMAFGCPGVNGNGEVTSFECWGANSIQGRDQDIVPDKECAGDVSESTKDKNTCGGPGGQTQDLTVEYNGKKFGAGGWHREPVYEVCKAAGTC